MKKYLMLSLIAVISMALAIPMLAQSNGAVDGGGQILEAPEDAKRPDWFVISFGGWVENTSDPVGEWQVNFHNVGVDAFDNSHFHGTDFVDFNLFNPNSGTCDAAMNFTLNGEWNGMPGYWITFRAGDDGAPSDGYADTVRVELYNSQDTLVYDTHWNSEFTNESSCVGSARTSLDAGNITIYNP